MKLLRWCHPLWFGGMALFAILFGLFTISSGGAVLFDNATRQATGNYVDFIVWFNFLAGFAYVTAGIGLWRWQHWAIWLSLSIAAATLLAFIAFGLYVQGGGSSELRTVAAMSGRTLAWSLITAAAYWKIIGSG
jgi:hypothetical protein